MRPQKAQGLRCCLCGPFIIQMCVEYLLAVSSLKIYFFIYFIPFSHPFQILVIFPLPSVSIGQGPPPTPATHTPCTLSPKCQASGSSCWMRQPGLVALDVVGNSSLGFPLLCCCPGLLTIPSLFLFFSKAQVQAFCSHLPCLRITCSTDCLSPDLPKCVP